MRKSTEILKPKPKPTARRKKSKPNAQANKPEDVAHRHLGDFTAAQKKQILERDGYKCVFCGRGEKDGVTLHVDYIQPKDSGGEATIENGQTLCQQHNDQKKTFDQTGTGKKMFIQLYDLAKSQKNEELMDFSAQVLDWTLSKVE